MNVRINTKNSIPGNGKLFVRLMNLVIILFVLSGSSCQITKIPQFPSWPEDDAGQASFVRQIIPVLYGRKVKGFGELAPLISYANKYGRKTLVQALMRDVEFVDHWSEVLVDDLEAHRSGTLEQSDCFGDPMLTSADSPDLAKWVRDNEAWESSIVPGPYNMSDLIRSSIKLDNLYPIYRGNLFTWLNKQPAAGDKWLRRQALGRVFSRVYLNRDMDCLICHNSDSSTTDSSSGWNRHYPIHGSFESALYGSSQGRDQDEVFALFRWDVFFKNPAGNRLEPWGLSGCGEYRDPTDPLYQIVADKDETGNSLQTYFTEALGDKATVWNLDKILHSGYEGLKDGLERTRTPLETETCNLCASSCSGTSLDISLIANNADNAVDVKNLLTGGSCGNSSCHDNGAASAGGLYIPHDDDHWVDHLINKLNNAGTEFRVTPGNSADSYLVKKLEGVPGITGSSMPPGSSIGDVQFVKDWIDSMPETTACSACSTVKCAELPKVLEGPEASTYLLAAKIVDNVWEEVMGTRLTIANYFPRNWVQRNLLWNLTDQIFIPSGWSLKELLTHILVSPYFNRKAPEITLRVQPYNLPNIFDPWTVIDPRKPPVTYPGYQVVDHLENHFNSIGDGIHRYSPRILLNSVHKALGWPAPKRFPDSTSYPNEDFMKSIGQYFSDVEPGLDIVDFQGLLSWETTHGQCVNPGTSPDWIDRFISQIHSPVNGLNLKDAIIIMRDWLLSEGRIETAVLPGQPDSEWKILEKHFGASLSTPMSSLGNKEKEFRQYCGVLLETPQFFLAGLAQTKLDPHPKLAICNESPCTFQEVCEVYRPAFEDLVSGASITCNGENITFSP